MTYTYNRLINPKHQLLMSRVEHEKVLQVMCATLSELLNSVLLYLSVEHMYILLFVVFSACGGTMPVLTAYWLRASWERVDCSWHHH